ALAPASGGPRMAAAAPATPAAPDGHAPAPAAPRAPAATEPIARQPVPMARATRQRRPIGPADRTVRLDERPPSLRRRLTAWLMGAPAPTGTAGPPPREMMRDGLAGVAPTSAVAGGAWRDATHGAAPGTRPLAAAPNGHPRGAPWPAGSSAPAPRGRAPSGHAAHEAYAIPAALALLMALLAGWAIVSGVLLGDRGGAPADSGPAPSAPAAADAATAPDEPSPAPPEAAGSAAAPAQAPPSAAATTAATAAAPTPGAPGGSQAGAIAAGGAAAASAGKIVLDDDAFTGGFSAPRNYRGRTARWIYGALSPYGHMTASFTVDGSPGAGELLVKGLDSETGDKTPLAIQVNDTVVFQGGNPLPKDTWRGAVAPWGEATIPLPAGALHAGRNTLTFSNLAPVDNFNAPPYFMLDEATITYDAAAADRPAPPLAAAPSPAAPPAQRAAPVAPAPPPAPLLARPVPALAHGGDHGRGHEQPKAHGRGH
ncbi:MAG TPA: hypothetical protein VII06_02525, partial [Chloroflexota bacterium]